MRTGGRTPNVVLFDLSNLEPAAAAAFLDDRAQRGCPAHAHWLIAAPRVHDLLAAKGPGADFLRSRLSDGDRLLCPNPTGFDWNALFPSEATAERHALAELAGPDALLFLADTPEAPAWLDGEPVLRASPEGLWIHRGQAALLPWSVEGGAWWIVPGQALVSQLPEGPWTDVLSVETAPRSATTRALSPGDKKTLHAVGVLRRADSPTPLRRAVLFRSDDFPGLMDKEAVDSDETLGGIRKRQLVASMQGQTTLTEGRLGVRFQGGRLVRVTDTATRSELCAGGSTYLEWGGKKRPFAVVSAFSFEGDFSWGLRQNLVLAHDDLAEPGRAVIDVYFVDESPELFAACTVRWPRWKTPETIQSWAPLELALFNAGTLTSRSIWPVGSQDRIHRGERSGVLSGTDFVLADKTSVAMGFPQNQTPRPHRLPWRLERGRLIVSPEGGNEPRPSSEFEGLEEHFTVYFTLAEGAKLPFSPTRKQAGELIPPYVLDLHERSDA
jgi:hypothetical protein